MPHLLNFVSVAILLDLALKSALVMLLTLLAVSFMRQTSAARRHLVWSLSVLSLLLLPLLSLALPEWKVTWLPRWMSETERITHLNRIGSPSSVDTVPSNIDAVAMAANEWPVEMTVPPTQPTVSQPTEKPLVSRPSSWMTWSTLLCLVWISGVLVSLVPLGVGLWQLMVLSRRSQPVRDQTWLSLIDELQRQLRIGRRVQLRLSHAALIPITWGVMRPVLLIPAEANEWQDQRRRLVLLHELAHIRRWDWLSQLVAHVVCALYWFNPLVWLAARRMQVERERACDDLVLGSGARATDYAQELLALAAALSDSGLSPLVAVPMSRYGALEDRLHRILDVRLSRTALTTAVVCLGMAVVAGGIAPLAMLRAAPPGQDSQAGNDPKDAPSDQKGDPNVDKPKSDVPSPSVSTDDVPARDLTPEELESLKTSIRISVLNSKGDRGIPVFRVIAGVPAGSVSSEYEKKAGRPVINWQPHTLQVGRNGNYIWPLAKAYDEMALRVEADGYEPQVFPSIKKADGPKHVVFMLSEDKGIIGHVKTFAGKPAAGATIAMALPSQSIVWEDGKLRYSTDNPAGNLRDNWRRPLFVKADADGKFRLPTEYEPAAIMIVHISGVLELSYDAWKKNPDVTLDRWGHISGQLQWQDTPGANEEISLTVHRDEYGYPGMVASYGTTHSDKDGRFTFDRVLPGLVQVSRPIKVKDDSNISSAILNGMFCHAKISSGDPTSVVLGGRGRTVTGKFVGLEKWDGATYHFHPVAPHIGFGGDNALWAAFGQFKQSPIGPIYFRDKQPINKDGTFRIEKLLPGQYQLFLSVPGFKGYAASTQMRIEMESGDGEPAAVDLGAIRVTGKPNADEPDPKPAVGDAAPPNPPKKKPIRTITVRGRVVDDVTGEPVTRMVFQGGHFDPADPKNITWGYFERSAGSQDGTFNTSIMWDEGWTERVVSDGYLPQPVLASAPRDDQNELDVIVRLKRGKIIRGVVLDADGKPVKDAAVFAIGPTGLNIAGRAKENAPRSVRTDKEGRFELPSGDAKSVAISCAKIDVWPAAIPASGDMKIHLPEPVRVDIDLDIEGANKNSVVFYQLLTHAMAGFEGVQSSREVEITNPGKLTLDTLPPGKYQFCRNVHNHLGEIGTGAMLDRQFLELKPGEKIDIRYVRGKGSRVRGKITRPADTKMSGIVISVASEKGEKGLFDDHEYSKTYSSQVAAEDGSFVTEHLAAGTYILSAFAYAPLTEQQKFRTGIIPPAFNASMKIEVPTDGVLTVPDLVLKQHE